MEKLIKTGDNMFKINVLVASLCSLLIFDSDAMAVNINDDVGVTITTLPIKSISENKVAIKDIYLSDNNVVVKLDRPFDVKFSAFDLLNGKQIIVDLKGVESQRIPLSINNKIINSVKVAPTSDRVRFVISLNEKANYQVVSRGDSIIISLATEGSAFNLDASITPMIPNMPPVKLTSPALVVNSLEKINFSRINDKLGRLTITFSDKNINPVVKRSGNLLWLEFDKTGVDVSLQKMVDVDRLGLATQSFDVMTQREKLKISLAQKDFWDYSVYQKGDKFVVDVKKITEYDSMVGAEKEKANKKQKLISLNFQNMEIKTVLQVIADFAGNNIIASKGVEGEITLRLQDVPWEKALDIVLESNGLEKSINGNVIWVATAKDIEEKQKIKLETQKQALELQPLKTEMFQVKRHKAKTIYNLIKSGVGSSSDSRTNIQTTALLNFGITQNAALTNSGSAIMTFLSTRGSVGYDERNNIVIVKDVPEKLEEIKKLVAKLDGSIRQVMIEAKLVVVESKYAKELGAKFGFLGRSSAFGTKYGIGATAADAQYVASGNQASTLLPIGNNSALPSAPLLVNAATVGLSIINSSGSKLLNLELSAMEDNNKGKVLSSPKVVTSDNQPAIIEQGTEIPYVILESSGGTITQTISFKKAALILAVKPQISPDGRVLMDLEINKDSVGDLIPALGGGFVPSINTKKMATQVTVGDGQTIVLGGVYENITKDNISKVPLLGDLPIIGNLFKTTFKAGDRAELIVFITPRIISDEMLDQMERTNLDDSIEISKEGSTKILVK